MKRKQVLVIGSGPVGLFTAWTISRAPNNNVEIFTTRENTRSNYSVSINGLSSEKANWYPQFMNSTPNYEDYGLIIIAKPYTLVHEFLLRNRNLWLSGKIKILALSSFSLKPTNYTYSNYVCFGWPNISVEINESKINATSNMQLLLWNDIRNHNSSKLKEFISSFNINAIRIKDLTYFIAKSMITYATYIVLLDKSIDFSQQSVKWTEIVFKQSNKLGLDIARVEKILCGGNLNSFSLQLFQTLHTYLSCKNLVGEAININILMQDQARLENYIKDYESQLIPLSN